MKTVPVQIVCRKCGTPYRTTVRASNTRCRKCRTSRYVRKDQQWEGPPSEHGAAESRAEQANRRAPVWCRCPQCEHEWQSRARDHVTLRCPECRNPVRVPRRRWENTQSTPRARLHYYSPEPVEPPAPAPARPAPAPYIGQGPTPGGLFAGLLSLLGQRPIGPLVEPEAPPAPAPARSARPRPARPAAPRPADTAPPAPRTADRETQRRDSIASLVRSLGGPVLVDYNAPSGRCEALDTRLPREQQRCPASASRRVDYRTTLHGHTHAFACPQHARDFADAAAPHDAVNVVVYMFTPSPVFRHRA